MKLTVRSKLFWISVLLMLCVGMASGLYLERQQRSWLDQKLEQDLKRLAETCLFAFQQPAPNQTLATMDQMADKLGQTTHARITLLTHHGVVLGDSELTLSQLKHIEKHHARPEIIAAKQNGFGVSRRLSTTLKKRMLYVAIPAKSKSFNGFIRVSMPMHEVEEATQKLLVLVLFAGIVGMIVAIFMSWLASYLFARMLRSVLQNTQALTMTGAQEDNHNGSASHFAGSLNSTAKRLEETVAAMVAERNRFEIVLENMNAAVIALDEKQVVQLVNRPALSMMGLEETPIGKHFKDIVDSEELLSLINKVQSGQPSSVELHIKGPPKRQFLVRATPLTNPGSSVMVLHDITELRRLERVRRDFVANVSHELRTPVSIIRANAETLLDGALEEPELAHDFLSALLRHAERLSNLVSDLLDISRIEANEYHLEREEIGLSLIIHRAHEAVEAILHNRQQTTSLQLEDDLMVLADVRSLEQVLLNMLDNAIKYTPAGGHITITSDVVDGFARIKVQDTGPGIKAKHRSRIFERFYRVDKGRSRDMGGTGLGLAIVKHLTETMGGQVGVEPTEPHGSIFWFTIPLAPTEDVSDNMTD